MKQGASISYKYNRTAQGLWMVLLGIPLLIAYGLGLILIIIGAVRMSGSGKAKKINKTGSETLGKIAYKVNEFGETITLLTSKRVIFYYELENGLLGRTNQSINKKTYEALKKLNGIVPIKTLGNRAVLDLNRIKNSIEESELEFSSQDPMYRYKYGEMTKKSIVLLIFAGIFFVLYVTMFTLFTYVVLPSSSSSTTPIYILILLGNFVFFFLALLFFLLGIRKMAFYGLAGKIRKDGNKGKKGKLIPIVSEKNNNTTLVLPNKAIFQYVAENGLLIQTTQSINKKLFKKIMEDGKDEIPISELNNYAVIDNKSEFGKEETKLDRILNFIKEKHIMYFFALLSTIYFLITEIIHFVSSGFADGISLFTIIMYGLTIIYISIMELLEMKNAQGNWAYLVTIFFLAANIVATIATISMSFAIDGLNFTHPSLINFFGAGIVYAIYIIFKLTKSIINAKKAKRLDLDYERCQGFGDIISNIYVIFNYLFWNIASWVYVMSQNMAEIPYFYLYFETTIFSIIIIINLIVSIIFISKCVKGLSKSNHMQKDDSKE